MLSSTRSNKETQLLFSPDPASLECSIRKEAHSLSTDNNTSVSLDYAQPPSTDTRSPLSTDNTHLLSSDIFHPTSNDIPSRTSIDTEPRGMVAPLILVRDNNGDRHDQEGQLRNAAGQRIDSQGAEIHEPDATVTGTTLPIDEAAQPKTSTRNNKETQLLFSPDPASLERSIRKEAHSLSTDNNTSVSLDYAQPPSTDTRSPLPTDNTHLLSSDIFHPTSIDIPSRTSIDTEPRGMVAPLILVRDNNGDRHDQEGQLRTCPAVPEATRKLNCYSHQILQVWNVRSSSTDNNTRVSLDSAQPPSTQTPVPLTDTRSPLSTDNTHLPSTDIFHPTSIDIPSRTSIDTEPRDMVAPLILVRDNNGDLHDQEGHLRNAVGQRIDA
ncbi:hypothetical protein F2Q69_00043231 [Brassica cretica]|uniref:Uncharacterized protein n=1 Tax=Brassica cretica TaxID=69181 RepID=A0A8S9NCK8_BRACR|nr:hypothetical protein F2Q69_00043231 [Brassica cretica]